MSNDQDRDTDSIKQEEEIRATLRPTRNKPGPKIPVLQEVTIEAKLIGRDKKPVPPKEVYQLAAIGCTNKDIARFFGVPEDNLPRHFAAELEKGREEMKITLRRAMFNNAVKNNNAAVQIFLAKNILGMSDHPISTEENKPLPWNSQDE